MASVKVVPNTPPVMVEPTEIYGSEGPILVRIATGGAGQSGLIRSLAEAFINDCSQQFSSSPKSKWPAGLVIPFRICWLAAETSTSLNHLAQNASDVSITYHVAAEKIAISQGVTDSWHYAWRDHWMLVGPKSNPAELPIGSQETVYDLFARIFCAAVKTAADQQPVRYLSRFDKSGGNACESKIWAAVGQIPWAHPYSTWYHQYIALPSQALRAASILGEYTLVDKGTWISVEKEVTDRLEVFAPGSVEENDPLLNPAHALVGSFAANKSMASAFVDWLTQPEKGQKVIENFAPGGRFLYSAAPKHDMISMPNTR